MANWFHKLFYDDNDVVTTPMSRIVQEQVDIRNAMTPNERLYTMFSKDEFGNMSPEMVSTVDLATIGGCIVGGVANSKNAHICHLDAKQPGHAIHRTLGCPAQFLQLWMDDDCLLDTYPGLIVLYLKEWLVW